MSEELKPCPFCGEQPLEDKYGDIVCSNESDIDNDPYLYSVGTWNTRPIEDTLRAENDALKKQLETAKKVLILIRPTIIEADRVTGTGFTLTYEVDNALAEIERIEKEGK